MKRRVEFREEAMGGRRRKDSRNTRRLTAKNVGVYEIVSSTRRRDDDGVRQVSK